MVDRYQKPVEEMDADEKRRYLVKQATIVEEWAKKGREFLSYSSNQLGEASPQITDNIVGYLRMLKDCIANQERLAERLKGDFNPDVNNNGPAKDNVVLITAKKPANRPTVYNDRLGKHVRPIELD